MRCPICEEKTEKLVKFDKEKMCPECAEHMQNEADLYESELEASYEAMMEEE